jgi:site-specific recombinase XerD
MEKNPTMGIDTPKQEQRTRTSLRTDEYSRILSLAGSSPRDFAIFQVFLQTGIRVSELCGPTLAGIDLTAGDLTVRDGKGQKDREIELEKKARLAIMNYLAKRPEVAITDALFHNRYGEPISERGARKLVQRFAKAAGLEKHVSPHISRHTYASHRAERNINVFQLQAWLGHKDPKTTMRYVHISRAAANKLQEATSL